jgi:hypothetical protein
MVMTISKSTRQSSRRTQRAATIAGLGRAARAWLRAPLGVLAFAAVFALVLGAGSPAAAQTAATSVVQGAVTDPQGAVIIGAEVRLLDTATNQVRTQATNDLGHFTFANILPGVYSITVSMEGFRTALVPVLRVEVNKSYTVNLALEVGSLAETVTVEAGMGAELQTTDAQVGNVLEERMIRNLPTLQRSTLELLSLQPATTPGGFGTGGTVSGARSDQNTLILDGIDVSDNLTGGQGITATQAPVGVDAVGEFRVTVANPNAGFARSAGGQVSMSSPRGSNQLHGVAYWYHQNDNLNANTWTNNRVDSDPSTPGHQPIPKGEMKDNRAGISLGGPFWPDRTFFFSNYEVRRFPQSAPFTRLVPTASLRSGVLTFLDGTGSPVAYPLASSMACGTAGDSPCDPRGLGISPTIQQMFAAMPAGNDPTLGDGRNTIGFRGTAPTSLTNDTVTFRTDHKIMEKLQFMGRYSYRRNLAPLGGVSQLDIRNPNQVVPLRSLDERGASVIAGLDYLISPSVVNTFRFGWVQSKNDLVGVGPSTVAAMLGFPGTNSSIGGVGLDLTGVDEPIAVTAQAARTQIIRDRNIQISNNVSWLKGSHTILFGGEFRLLPFLFTHNDQVTFLTGPVAQMHSGSFLTIPATNRPPTCGEMITMNCIREQDVTQWNNLYAGTLGLVDNVNIVGARDGNLQPLPFGTDLITDTTMKYFQFHFQDTWRLRPSLTLTYGLTYSWLTPPKEALNRIGLVTDLATGEVFSRRSYLGAKEAAALRGEVFNPELGVRPIADSVRDTLFDTDYGNIGPRVAVAWSPSFSSGLGNWLLGDRRGAVRAGFGIVYDRVNTISVVLPAAFGIGFGQVLQLSTPLCDASSSPGPGCDPSAGAANRALSSFRVGQDGNIPIPDFPPGTSPIVPAVLSGGITFATDPERKVGRNYVFDLTIQRELPANLLFEVGYIGRLGRDLPIGVDLDASPYFFVDPASGQSFAEAFDNVACVLRGDAGRSFGGFTCPASVMPQPWFENQLPGLGTAFLTGSFSSLFQTNSVSTLFLQMNVFRELALGLPAYNNLQLLAILMASHGGISNYHAMFFTLRNRSWHGLQFDVNYTLAKSLDQAGNVQNNLALISTGFNPGIDYGAALSDRRHIFNSIFQYDLPLGTGRRWSANQGWLNNVIGGWYVAGIFRAFTSLPFTVGDNAGVFGGGLASLTQPAIPLVSPGALGAGIHSGVAGSGGVGTTGNPATGGSGLNLFSDPEAAFNSFRRILLSQDGRTGQANHFRGPGFWNLDLRVAKETRITERVSYEFSFDFFNVFNHVNLNAPSLSLNSPAAFGVFTSQFTPPNRTDGARWIQFGSRIRF